MVKQGEENFSILEKVRPLKNQEQTVCGSLSVSLKPNWFCWSDFLSKEVLLYKQDTPRRNAKYSCMMQFLTVPSHPVGERGWRREGGDRRVRHTSENISYIQCEQRCDLIMNLTGFWGSSWIHEHSISYLRKIQISNPFVTFWDILFTNRQTEKQTGENTRM